MIEQQKDVFEKNILKFGVVKAEIIKKKNNIVRNKIETYFNSKINSVSGLVARLFAEKDETKREKILKGFMPEKEVQIKAGSAQREVVKIIDKEIKEFFKVFAEDMANLNFEASKSEIFTKTNSDIKVINGAKNAAKLMDGLGLASGVILSLGTTIVVSEIGILGASGTLFGLGSANFWNPVGWGLLASSILAGIAGWILKSKHKKKVAEAKIQAKNKISGKLRETKRKLLNEMNKWVNKVLRALDPINWTA